MSLIFLHRTLVAVSLLAAICASLPLAAEDKVHIAELPKLEAPITSFGAAVADGQLYVYGGHLGSPHEYSAELQAKKLLRLDLAKPEKWTEVAEGPRRTGLAMVAFGGRIYRIGGWESRNETGEKWKLYSMPDFARFDPKSGKWEDLAPLPRGRSSHDAAVVGSKVYVIGGWELKGEGEGDWHDTAFVCDLADSQPQWQEIAKPPFRRRALAVAGHAGKVFVLGGMSDSNEATTAVDIYNPADNSWSQGPALPGDSLDGFGVAAVGAGDNLLASGRAGIILRLNHDGKGWNQIGKLNHARYFHRIAAVDESRLVVVGGTSRSGKISQVELLQLPPKQ